VVEDVTVYQGRVVVVIGVTAVMKSNERRRTRDTYRAAEVRWCRPSLHALSIDAPYKPVRSGSDVTRGGRRVAR
jgi:hypothetical protein